MLLMNWFERESDIEILRSKASLVQRENDVLHRKLVELKGTCSPYHVWR